VEVDCVFLAGQARAISEALLAYLNEQDPAEAAPGLSLLLEVGAAQARQLAALQGRLWRRLSSADRTFNCQQAGLMLRDLHEQTAEVLTQLGQCLGADSPGAAAFRQEQARLLSLREEFQRDWPLFDPAELEEANQRVRRGEFVRVEDMLRELGHPA
jgi:hypothetical protein